MFCSLKREAFDKLEREYLTRAPQRKEQSFKSRVYQFDWEYSKILEYVEVPEHRSKHSFELKVIKAQCR